MSDPVPWSNSICDRYLFLMKWPFFFLLSETEVYHLPGRIAQSVTCLTADPGVASLIPALSYTFTEVHHEMGLDVRKPVFGGL